MASLHELLRQRQARADRAESGLASAGRSPAQARPRSTSPARPTEEGAGAVHRPIRAAAGAAPSAIARRASLHVATALLVHASFLHLADEFLGRRRVLSTAPPMHGFLATVPALALGYPPYCIGLYIAPELAARYGKLDRLDLTCLMLGAFVCQLVALFVWHRAPSRSEVFACALALALLLCSAFFVLLSPTTLHDPNQWRTLRLLRIWMAVIDEAHALLQRERLDLQRTAERFARTGVAALTGTALQLALRRQILQILPTGKGSAFSGMLGVAEDMLRAVLHWETVRYLLTEAAAAVFEDAFGQVRSAAETESGLLLSLWARDDS